MSEVVTTPVSLDCVTYKLSKGKLTCESNALVELVLDPSQYHDYLTQGWFITNPSASTYCVYCERLNVERLRAGIDALYRRLIVE